jgi:predicted transcriptional regulator of viral defense system
MRPIPPRLTKAAKQVAETLAACKEPVITPSRLKLEIDALYSSGKKLNLPKSADKRVVFARIKRNLIQNRIILADADYHTRCYRVLSNPDGSPEDICCIVDPNCAISHISALHRFGITVRRSLSIHLTTFKPRKHGTEVGSSEADDPRGHADVDSESIRTKIIRHPTTVRGQSVEIHYSQYPRHAQPIRDTFARISTIGQTFLDTLTDPALCGGMRHVLEIWREHAAGYKEEIIRIVDESSVGLAKIRAGYILSELLGLKDQRVLAWVRFAQRGGSRVLDPERPYAPKFSERWMLSLNA